MATYQENVYNMLKRRGLDAKYEHAGIYCIRVDGQIFYIGKSHNMLRRVAQHYVGIKTESECKYRILSEAKRKGHRVSPDVLYYAKGQNYYDITEEIGAKEGEYIREYKPVLNTQIPKEEDWSKFEVRQIEVKNVLDRL